MQLAFSVAFDERDVLEPGLRLMRTHSISTALQRVRSCQTDLWFCHLNMRSASILKLADLVHYTLGAA